MKMYRNDEQATEIPRLSLKPKEAAVSLGMSDKALWNRTAPRGDIPAVKVGSRTCYFVHQLKEWADERLAKQQQQQQQSKSGRNI